MTTPMMPSSTPASRLLRSFSSVVRRCATIAADSGVAAFNTDARPTPISFWPQKIRLKGMTLLIKPMMKYGIQSAKFAGIFRPMVRTTKASAAAPMVTRHKTMVNGASSFTATLPKKNEPPQRTERIISRPHSVGPMRSSRGGDICQPVACVRQRASIRLAPQTTRKRRIKHPGGLAVQDAALRWPPRAR